MRRNGGPTSGQGLADPEYVDLQFVVDQQVWRYQIATYVQISTPSSRCSPQDDAASTAYRA